MVTFASVDEQLALLTRGAVDLHQISDLKIRLHESIKTGKPLRVKAGFDPTKPDLHLGHAVLLAKMRQFQDLGHTAILLVGEFTAMVGDPTGHNEARPRLTRESIRKSAETYTSQAFKILDPEKTELRANSEWHDTLSSFEFVELCAKTTVSRMLERNDFAKRFKEEKPIYQHEFLYPLLQAYDSVALENDVELGGTDQLFNLLMGRDLMPKYGKRPQIVLTVPLLEGIDAKMDGQEVVGKKMSKSSGNYIALTESPMDIFRKVMQIDDDVIFRYFELLSRRSNKEIDDLKEDRKRGRHPLEIKALFAKEIIESLHSEAEANEAEKTFQSVYSANKVPDQVQEIELTSESETMWIAHALFRSQLVKSTGEARRLIEQGGVEVNQKRLTDVQWQLQKGGRYLLKVGSKNRKFVYVTIR